jgi:periplasmic divalent cation tolerance protein
MSTITLNLCTCPDQAVAERIAASLLEGKLAACVNILPGIVSMYRWQGEIARDAEVLLLIKTSAERRDAMQQALRDMHPYEVPEIISLPVTAGHQPYIDWVRQCTI